MRVTEVLPAAQGGTRVTETVYNADDSVHQVKRAVGTALAQTYATTTYSANGLPVTLTDAKGNRTTYEYDGHVICQGSCHVTQAAFFTVLSSWRIGLSQTVSGRSQFRVAPRQRSG